MAANQSPGDAKSPLRNVLVIVLLVGVAIGIVAGYFIQRFRAEALAGQNWAVTHFGLASPVQNRLADEYTDADGDLLADAPLSSEELISPEVLTFTYIAGDAQQTAELWQPLVDALRQATGLPVEYRQYDNLEAQLAALKAGQLHICGFNTGAVPRAVNASGFIPRATIGKDDQSFGVNTKLIVPAESTIQTVEELKGETITFTNTSSNSGFKAPVVILKEDFGMAPDRDYKYSFSTSHDESICRISQDELVAATVASDLIERAIASNQIQPGTLRVLYTSERFPPAAFGYAYNLQPAIAEKIGAVLTSFELNDEDLSRLIGAAGATRLVPVTYKDDWALIRRIDNALGIAHTGPTGDAGTAREEATAAEES